MIFKRRRNQVNDVRLHPSPICGFACIWADPDIHLKKSDLCLFCGSLEIACVWTNQWQTLMQAELDVWLKFRHVNVFQQRPHINKNEKERFKACDGGRSRKSKKAVWQRSIEVSCAIQNFDASETFPERKLRSTIMCCSLFSITNAIENTQTSFRTSDSNLAEKPWAPARRWLIPSLRGFLAFEYSKQIYETVWQWLVSTCCEIQVWVVFRQSRRAIRRCNVGELHDNLDFKRTDSKSSFRASACNIAMGRSNCLRV